MKELSLVWGCLNICDLRKNSRCNETSQHMGLTNGGHSCQAQVDVPWYLWPFLHLTALLGSLTDTLNRNRGLSLRWRFPVVFEDHETVHTASSTDDKYCLTGALWWHVPVLNLCHCDVGWTSWLLFRWASPDSWENVRSARTCVTPHWPRCMSHTRCKLIVITLWILG